MTIPATANGSVTQSGSRNVRRSITLPVISPAAKTAPAMISVAGRATPHAIAGTATAAYAAAKTTAVTPAGTAKFSDEP